MPCPFTGPKMFIAGPNFLSRPKNLTAFSASSKTVVPAQKPILLNANHIFIWHKMFVTATNYVNKFLFWHNKTCQFFRQSILLLFSKSDLLHSGTKPFKLDQIESFRLYGKAAV